MAVTLDPHGAYTSLAWQRLLSPDVITNASHRYGVSTVDGVPWIVMERALMSLTGYLDSVGHGNLAYNVSGTLLVPGIRSTVLM